MTQNTCNQCRGETTITKLDETEGSADSVTVSIHHMPVSACEQGHRQFVRPEFAAQLLNLLAQEEEKSIPAAEEKGLLRKRYLCEGCGTELEAKPDHRHTFAVDVELEALDPFQVELTMPVYKCPACEKEQLHSLKEVRKKTPQALAEAFKTAEIPPPAG
jgi:hypothetical protein